MLCKHDWVGDDECAYCRCEELEADNAALRHDNERYLEINAELASQKEELAGKVERLESLLRSIVASYLQDYDLTAINEAEKYLAALDKED